MFHVDGERGFRGGERQLLYLAAALKARGHRNVIACRRGEALEAEAARQGFETLPLPFYCELDPLTALPLRARAAKSERPVLHAHTAHAAGVAMLASCFGGPARVSHRRVDFALGGGLSRRCKYGRAGGVVAVSRAIADVMSGPGLSRESIAVVPDGLPVDVEECGWAGVDAARFAPPSPEERAEFRSRLAAEFNLGDDLFWIGNAAALVPHKDHDTLIAAALIVLLNRPKTLFLIAGEGPEKERLFTSIKRTGLTGRVLLLGHRPDALPVLKACDAFCLSSWGEGMGSVLLEAAACGLPIAATTAGGIPEVVEDGRSALLCPPRSPEALAQNLLRLIDDAALRRRLTDAARADLPKFGLARMAEQLEKVYEAALA